MHERLKSSWRLFFVVDHTRSDKTRRVVGEGWPERIRPAPKDDKTAENRSQFLCVEQQATDGPAASKELSSKGEVLPLFEGSKATTTKAHCFQVPSESGAAIGPT